MNFLRLLWHGIMSFFTATGEVVTSIHISQLEHDAPYLDLVRAWMETPGQWTAVSGSLFYHAPQQFIHPTAVIHAWGDRIKLEIGGCEVALTPAGQQELREMVERFQAACVAAAVLRAAEGLP